jgi:hypothetical protein
MTMIKDQKIRIAIDTYDELFSDFDISPFENRSISLDFKEALESRTIENNNSNLELILSIPEKERNLDVEKIIIKRLKRFFISKKNNYSKRIGLRKTKGIKFILMGFLFVTITFLFETFFTDLFPLFLANVILILGWFGVWTGVERILDIPYELISKKNLYTLFSNLEIVFVNEEDLL